MERALRIPATMHLPSQTEPRARRRLFRCATTLLLATHGVAAATPLRAQRGAADTLHVGLLLPRNTADARAAQVARGAVMSVEESARVAPLLGRAIVLDSVRDAAQLPRGVRILIDAGGASLPRERSWIVLDAACAGTAAGVRGFSMCAPSSRTGADSAIAWDSSLEKFGGSSLNARFEARWHLAMDDEAWRGWLAAKIAWESALRGPRDPEALARWLASGAARFDGHQGVALSFGPDRRLRHPSYRVVHRDGKRAVEVIP